MGFFDDILNFGEQILTGSGANSGGSYNWVLPMITAGLGTVAAYNQPEPEMPYANTQEGFEAQQALAREELAQRMEIAKLQASAAGAGSGAAVQAARIAAASQMAQLKKKIKADILAKELDSASHATDLAQISATNLGQAALKRGELGQTGLQNVAALIAGGRR